MKSFKILFFTLVTLVSCLSITQLVYAHGAKDTKKLAEVNQNNGIYIFIQSHPVQEYVVLGTVEKNGVVLTGKPREMQNILLRRAKKDYPQCDGIIFDNVEMTHAICIKFK